MSDYYAPLQLDEQVFNDLLQKLDRAFAENDAALVFSEFYGGPEIDLLGDVGLSDEQAAAVPWFDQLLYHALSDSPEGMIREWASHHDESLGDRAVERAQAVGATRHLAAVWRAKSATILPQLVGVRSEVIRGPDDTMQAVLALKAATVGLLGQPDPFSRQELLVQLHRTDIAYLQAELDLLASELETPSSKEQT
jgi:hypothetical protein